MVCCPAWESLHETSTVVGNVFSISDNICGVCENRASNSSLINMCGIALSLSGVHIEGHLGVTADREIPTEQQEVRTQEVKRVLAGRAGLLLIPTLTVSLYTASLCAFMFVTLWALLYMLREWLLIWAAFFIGTAVILQLMLPTSGCLLEWT